MALGNSRPRNWGKESQQTSLLIACRRGKVDYRIRKNKHSVFLGLFAKDHKNDIELPVAWECELVNEKHGAWVSRSIQDGAAIARGVSQCDVIFQTIRTVWH
jgi:hypothetical protein